MKLTVTPSTALCPGTVATRRDVPKPLSKSAQEDEDLEELEQQYVAEQVGETLMGFCKSVNHFHHAHA